MSLRSTDRSCCLIVEVPPPPPPAPPFEAWSAFRSRSSSRRSFSNDLDIVGGEKPRARANSDEKELAVFFFF